jgi:hypothetical protein
LRRVSLWTGCLRVTRLGAPGMRDAPTLQSCSQSMRNNAKVLSGPNRAGHLVAGGFMLAPMAFQAEWPPFMNFASNPRSRSAIAIWHPT